MAGKNQSSKGNPAAKRMVNPNNKAKRSANKAANERAAKVFAKDHPEVSERDRPKSRTAIRHWERHSAPRFVDIPADIAEGVEF